MAAGPLHLRRMRERCVSNHPEYSDGVKETSMVYSMLGTNSIIFHSQDESLYIVNTPIFIFRSLSKDTDEMRSLS